MTKGGVCLPGKGHQETQTAISPETLSQLHGWFWLGFRFLPKWSLERCINFIPVIGA